jgi:hypothetical protein
VCGRVIQQVHNGFPGKSLQHYCKFSIVDLIKVNTACQIGSCVQQRWRKRWQHDYEGCMQHCCKCELLLTLTTKLHSALDIFPTEETRSTLKKLNGHFFLDVGKNVFSRNPTFHMSNQVFNL